MTSRWAGTVTQIGDHWGVYQVVMSAPGLRPRDVTFLRGVPTLIQNYSSADPFGDAAANIQFPQISIYEEPGLQFTELDCVRDYASVTINWLYWPVTMSYADLIALPLSSQTPYQFPVYEGFVSSFEWSHDGSTYSLSLQCKGAMFQVDNYLAKPDYPARPIPYEHLIADCFDHKKHPDLRTTPLRTIFPSGWDIQAPNYANTPSYLTPVGVTPGQNITGYFTRNTGAWEKSLTSFIQGLLADMLDDTGQQWTMRMDPGRKPVLYLRVSNPTPDYTISAGTPGVSITVSRDLTQFANVFYGQGTDTDGTEWDRQEVSANGQETAYAPLAFDPRVYPEVDNPQRDPHQLIVEAYNKFNNGFDERQALIAAKQILNRDMDPGIQGTITLAIDPPGAFKGQIKAGQSILVTNLLGADTGVLFHISQASHSPINFSVELTVDTKFRDLLTVDEVLARTRDPLTPVNMLKINSRQILVPDLLVPWNYKKGSGFIPNHVDFFKDMPTNEAFPYPTHSTSYPPKKHPHMYTEVFANAKSRLDRWTIVPIRMSEAGTIRLVQVSCHDANGHILKIPFHFSLYYAQVSADEMPYDNKGPSPFIPGAFESTDQFGQIIPAGTGGATLLPSKWLAIGWGNQKQPAGYSPGAKTAGDPLTGLLIDEQQWQFTMSNNPAWRQTVAAGFKEPQDAYTMYGMFYAEYHDHVFFRGRMYVMEPGNG